MDEPIIKVEKLGKRYQLGAVQTYKTLRESVMDAIKSPLRGFRKRQSPDSSVTELWALRDVSFEVKPGEVVGIIGRNGAGKSTLLRVLSRITDPTEGAVEMTGRVGSLLEVGTGFHPELTGRENIYLNGAILGMTRVEIARKFDEIVDFAGVEKFLDTPVKRFSSGMYMRLAFGVAANLDPEILIVDEVLAVGDAEFQKKCLRKMKDVASYGRTVIFVSHNMAAVSNLCTACIVMRSGTVIFNGATHEGIEHYLNSEMPSDQFDPQRYRPAWAKSLIQSARLTDEAGAPRNVFLLGTGLVVEMTFCTPADAPLTTPVMGVCVNHATFGPVAGVNTRMTGFEPQSGPFTSGVMRCRLPDTRLLQGSYTIDVWLGDGPADVDTLQGALSFEIESADIYGTGKTPFGFLGVSYLHPTWEFESVVAAGESG